MSISSTEVSLFARGRYCGRSARLLALVPAVLAAHWLLLQGLAGGRAALAMSPAPAPGAVHLRTLALAPPVPAVAAALPAPAAPTAAAKPTRVAPSAAQAPAEAPAAPRSADLPLYRTQMPPPFTLGYELTRGGARGSAALHWQSDGEHYEAQLAASVDGTPLLSWHSAGGFDTAGIAPTRHTDRRRGRSTQAANFQRDSGKVSFSGPTVEYALRLGVQDRLSWLLQLAAIAAADPALVGPGGRVSLLVVGARGDADIWHFIHAGVESQGTSVGVRLVREPDNAYDTRVEVWLDPALHYLPLRLRLSNAANATALDFTLREALFAP